MPTTRVQKEEIITGLKQLFADSPIAIFLNFHGLSVKETMAMRRDFLTHGLQYRVAKKTLFARAMKAAFGKEPPALKGEIGAVWGSDPLVTTKAVVRAAKGMKALTVQGGWWEGAWIDTRQIVMLAAIPGREALLAQLIMMLNTPIRNTVGALAGIPRKFVGILEAIKQTKTE